MVTRPCDRSDTGGWTDDNRITNAVLQVSQNAGRTSVDTIFRWSKQKHCADNKSVYILIKPGGKSCRIICILYDNSSD